MPPFRASRPARQNRHTGGSSDDTAPVTPQFCHCLGCRHRGARVRPLRARRRAAAAALSLDTAPSHLRNVSIKDYLGKVEAASGGKIKTEVFESGQLYPDLEVGKALIQGQVEMAAPGSWTITGIVSDADCFQLPVLYGQPIELIHRVIDGKPGAVSSTARSSRSCARMCSGPISISVSRTGTAPTSRSHRSPTSRA